MTKEQYLKISEPFRQDQKKAARMRFANKLCTVICYVGYALLLLSRIILLDVRFWRLLLIPAAAFLILSIVRKQINAQRPYEVWQITPLIEKDTKGKSFPSRHVFSAAIIAMAVLSVYLPGGIILLAAAIVLSWCRVIGGVHFVKDVVTGLAIGVIVGLVGFFII